MITRQVKKCRNNETFERESSRTFESKNIVAIASIEKRVL